MGDVNCGPFLVLGAGNERDTWGRASQSCHPHPSCSDHLFGNFSPVCQSKEFRRASH